jgi:ABC-type antimicrobial peptide transport system permease subunit
VFDVVTIGADDPGAERLLPDPHGRRVRGALGLLGLMLALVGVYGVVSYAASQRTQEIGVRMALGASRSEILRLVLGRGLVLVGGGLLTGLAVAFGVSRLLSNFLFNVSAVDSDHVRRRPAAARRDGARRLLDSGVPRHAHRSGGGAEIGIA